MRPLKWIGVLLGVLAFLGAVVAGFKSSGQRRASQRVAELLPHQALVSALSPEEQQRHLEIRGAVRHAEQQRAANKRWPADFLSTKDVVWKQSGQRLYINYLGVPADGARLRWLVLFIEPEPSAIKDPPPPEDEEHHTLPDGTGLHVTVWTSPNVGPLPLAVLPFPAAEGWTQRLGAAVKKP